MTQAIFDFPSAVRVAKATQAVEQSISENQLDRWFRRSAVPVHGVLGFMKETITYNETAKAFLAQGTPTNETATTTERVVYNTLRMTIWEGSPVLIRPPRVTASGPQAHWHIEQAYSATRIRGTNVSRATGPTTITLNSVSPMDGHFGSVSISAFLLPGYVLNANQQTIAYYNEQAAQWESMGCCVCPCTTTLPPTTQPPITTLPPTTQAFTTLPGTTLIPPTTLPPTSTIIPTTLPGTTLIPTTSLPPVTTLPPTTLVPPTTLAPTTLPPTTLPPVTTLPPTTIAPTTLVPPTTTIIPTTLPPTTLIPTTTLPPVTTLAPTTLVPPTTTIIPTTLPPTTLIPTTTLPPVTTLAPTTLVPPTTTIIPTTLPPTTLLPTTTLPPTTLPPTTLAPTTGPPTYPCNGCLYNLYNETMTARLTGFSNTAGCSNCNSKNNDYTVTRIESSCVWYYYEGDISDPIFDITVAISSSGIYTTVRWSYRGDLGCAEGNAMDFEHVTFSGLDCLNLDIGLDLDPDSIENPLGCTPGSVRIIS